ncbi:MAG: hypothetical protein ACAI35_27135 [Candidatus Methylacidiphilales bacterium]|nr:hypothetical protein [Candidatus Methylacidiphilales bacterium]
MDHDSGVNIAYSEFGWAPLHPWCLVLHESQEQWMGDNAYRTFLDAFFESLLSEDVNIWTVYIRSPDGTCIALIQEDSWDKMWEIIEALRIEQPESRFSCKAGIEHDSKSYLPQQRELTL